MRLPAVEDLYCGWERHHRDFLHFAGDLIADFLEPRLGRRIDRQRGADGLIRLPEDAHK